MTNLKHEYYPESRFGGFTDIDGTIAFYLRVNSLVTPSSVVLDFGCGRGRHAEDQIRVRRELRILKGKARRVIGLDVDEAAGANPFLDEFHILKDGGPWPLDDDSVDICVCGSVLEHMPAPESFFSEARRVIRRGGYLCINTPNLWSYSALFSMLVPNRLHAGVLSKLRMGREGRDVFPTYYRCNTIPRVRAMLRRYGFRGVVYGYDAEPSYLSVSRVAYFLGVMHQRCAPSFLRPVIFVFASLRGPVGGARQVGDTSSKEAAREFLKGRAD